MVRSPSLTDKRARYEASPPRHDNCAACRRHRHFAEPLRAGVGEAFSASTNASARQRGGYGPAIADQSRISFIDGDSGSAAWIGIRVAGDAVGLATSIEANGDVEVFFGRGELDALVEALGQARRQLE